MMKIDQGDRKRKKFDEEKHPNSIIGESDDEENDVDCSLTLGFSYARCNSSTTLPTLPTAEITPVVNYSNFYFMSSSPNQSRLDSATIPPSPPLPHPPCLSLSSLRPPAVSYSHLMNNLSSLDPHQSNLEAVTPSPPPESSPPPPPPQPLIPFNPIYFMNNPSSPVSVTPPSAPPPPSLPSFGTSHTSSNSSTSLTVGPRQQPRIPRNPTQVPRNGESEDIYPPFPWATDQRATVHSLQNLLSRNIKEIEGEAQCRRCEARQVMKHCLEEKFREVASFIAEKKEKMHTRAPKEWMSPVFPECVACGQPNSMRPVVAEKKRQINWLFMLLGQSLGCCTIQQLKYFCKHSNHHRTGAKDRLLYLTYLGICKQLHHTNLFDP